MATAKSRQTTVNKAAARKPRAKKSGGKKAVARKTEPVAAAASAENVRNVFLAGLGLYGKAFEKAQNQIRENRDKLEQRRERAGEFFEELVKRGERLESDTRKKLKEFDLPELGLTDSEELRERLRARLDKARDSFDTLRNAASEKSEAG